MNSMCKSFWLHAGVVFICCTKKPEPVKAFSPEKDPYTLSIHGTQVHYSGITAELLGPKEPWVKMFDASLLDEEDLAWPELGIDLVEERDENGELTGLISCIMVELAPKNETDIIWTFPGRLELDGVWIHPDMDWKNVKLEKTEGFKDLAPDISLYPSRHERFMARWWTPPQDGQCRSIDYTLYTNGRDKVLRFEACVDSFQKCPSEEEKVVTTMTEEEKNELMDQVFFDVLRTMDDSPELQAKFEQAEQEIKHMKRPERDELFLELLQQIKKTLHYNAHMEIPEQNNQIGTDADKDD